MTLQRIRESLALTLIVLLPFHAFALTVLSHIFVGGGAAPLASLALWKESLLVVLLAASCIEIFRRGIEGVRSFFQLDTLDLLLVALLILGLWVSNVHHVGLKHVALGLRYDFVPLIAFFVLRRVQWSDQFFAHAVRLLLIVGSIVAVYGLATAFLSQQFFSLLGYSDLHSLYRPNAPLAAFQQIGGTDIRRIQSVMSGPNQLGMWLLLPFAIALLTVLRNHHEEQRGLAGIRTWITNRLHGDDCFCLVATLLFGTLIVLTFSRAAWIAAATITVIALVRTAGADDLRRTATRLIGALLAVGLLLFLVFPDAVLRAASSRDHVLRPLAALQMMAEHPWGKGLASAGPAQNRIGSPCVYLPEGADTSWTEVHADLCVIVGEQLITEEKQCNCPFLPENWYLQIGVEMGWIGLCIFVVFMFLLLHRLAKRTDGNLLYNGVFLAMLGVSIAAMVLHAWEDAAVAYTLFLFAAAILQLKQKKTED